MTHFESGLQTKLITETIEKLRGCTQLDVQSNWRCSQYNFSLADVAAADWWQWNQAELNHKKHIAWERGTKVRWLIQKIVVAENLQGYPLSGLCLRLALVWFAESAQVYVNGNLVAEGDLFDSNHRVLLSSQVLPGDEFVVALRLVSPGHDDGALVSSKCVYEARDNQIDPGFVADELAVILYYCEAFAPDRLDDLAGLVSELDVMNHEDAKDAKEEEEERLVLWREKLIASNFVNSNSKIYLLGHAHLDMAWLWRVSETWEVAQSTFESVLQLQQDFSELVFGHSTPALYAWIEEHRPDLFAKIKQAIATQTWEVIAGMWVEPDLNLIAGESIVRQILYGQRYVWQKFGRVSSVVWLPDSFGFCATLPQFLIGGGIEYFVTQKLRWNDSTQFPYELFWWRSPDGSQINCYMSAPIGETVDVVKMVQYAIAWQKQTGLQDCLWLPGVGDHGGGPTRDMLEITRRSQSSPIFPQLEFTTVEKYLQQIFSGVRSQESGVRSQESGVRSQESGVGSRSSQRSQKEQGRHQDIPPLPTWKDELYFQFHRGCYTTHADQKRWNRRSENLLYAAELFAALASLCCGVSYPQTELETAWKNVLFNQFHDILPGSAIAEVYLDALPQWEQTETLAKQVLHQSLNTLASQVALPNPPHGDSFPIFVFNALNWQRSEVVAVSLPSPTNNQQWQIYNGNGEPVVSQLGADSQLLFLADRIPAVGYSLFWLCPQVNSFQTQVQTDHNHTTWGLRKQETFSNQNFTLENEFLRVTVDEQTGELNSVFDKINNREVLSQNGNQLQAFTDSGQYWDAWNIDPNYQQHPLPSAQLKSITWLEQGSLRNSIRVVRLLGNSEFRQDYILSAASPMLKIATQVDWRERQVLVKAAFHLNVEADEATYEIPCGAIRRPTKPQTGAEKAKWEVPALRWADLTQGDKDNSNSYGVSLLNDCKYGYDAQPNQLRLTLLKSPEWPDFQADKGMHEFTYALYPHGGSWEKAHTVRRGYELNLPLQPELGLKINSVTAATALTPTTPSKSFIDLSADNLILMAFKIAEDDPKQWILRCYECHGETAQLKLHLLDSPVDSHGDRQFTSVESVDLLERPLPGVEFSSNQQNFTIHPWKIATFKLRA